MSVDYDFGISDRLGYWRHSMCIGMTQDIYTRIALEGIMSFYHQRDGYSKALQLYEVTFSLRQEYAGLWGSQCNQVPNLKEQNKLSSNAHALQILL